MTLPADGPTFGLRWELPPPVGGIRILRTPSALTLSMPQPGRRAVLLRLGAAAATAGVTFVLALVAHPPQRLAAVGVGIVAVAAALAAAVLVPLVVAAAWQRRRVVLTEGVLLLQEGGEGLNDALRDDVRAVRLHAAADGRTATIEIEVTVSGIALRQAAALAPQPADDEEVVALLALDHEPRERAQYLATVVAAWADVALETTAAPAPRAGTAPDG